MPFHNWSKILLVACAPVVAISGCSTPSRLPAVPQSTPAQVAPAPLTIRYLVTRETASFSQEAGIALDKEKAWLVSQGQTGPLPPASYLAISGGGDNGAYGAGFLNGCRHAPGIQGGDRDQHGRPYRPIRIPGAEV